MTKVSKKRQAPQQFAARSAGTITKRDPRASPKVTSGRHAPGPAGAAIGTTEVPAADDTSDPNGVSRKQGASTDTTATTGDAPASARHLDEIMPMQ